MTWPLRRGKFYRLGREHESQSDGSCFGARNDLPCTFCQFALQGHVRAFFRSGRLGYDTWVTVLAFLIGEAEMFEDVVLWRLRGCCW